MALGFLLNEVVRSDADVAPVDIVLNWDAALKRSHATRLRGQNRKPRAARQSIHPKVAVQRDYAGDPLALGGTNECRVGKVHRQITVLLHQHLHACQIGHLQIEQEQDFVRHHVAQRIDAAWRISQHVHRLGESGPYRGERFANVLERFDRSLVRRVVSIQQRDQCAGVNEYAGHDASA